ncbi:hypothetical protein BLNAU_13550 [Blattamonas nauphoetae]|uniref:Protein kinase domain-containing protein n=1 Tax=Blattamonas nauphoetae TaxID=2049346 RepID=A0ABQ9XJL6_9EUKA|nr:hypothetical protein BLNAU_13550 [Blattamonas nauphoetae]
MYTSEFDDQYFLTYTRVELPVFNMMGPYLTQKVEALFDAELRRIDLIMKGNVPLDSQTYEVTVKEADKSSELTGQLKFVGGVGSLLPSSDLKLKFSTAYTITKIVGVVESSSESNAIDVTAEAWAFNFAAFPPSYLSFTTPDAPPCLTGANPYLLSKEPQYAYIVLLFNQEVAGSFDIVVEERGKDVTITVPFVGTSLTGESDKFVVVGDKRLLTHDTSYTIKSLSPTPGTESTTTPVCMIDTITFHIPQSPYNPNKSMSPETKALLSWLIPLVSCLLLALIVLVIVLVLLRRRYKKSQVPVKEMEEQDHVQVEDKMEVVAGDNTDQVLHSDGMSHSAFDSSSNLPNANHSREGFKSQTEAEWVEVMSCNGGFEISSAPMTNTLYSVLHKEHRDVGKRVIGLQIVNGLKQVVANRGWSDVLTRLSSHWILIDECGNVQLKLQMNASEAEHEKALTQMQNPIKTGNGNEQHVNGKAQSAGNEERDKSGMDGLRWRAPEVVGSNGGHVDGHKASVFSLGLVLWEIETGLVPFGELDAVNAQRQSGTGTPPKMELLKDEEFVSLIHRCVSVDPEQRPTLAEVGEFLSSHPSDTIRGSPNEMKE